MIRDRNQPINILLAEDNPGDVFIIKTLLKESQVFYNLHAVVNGLGVTEFLNQEGEYSNVPRPDLILLDLNLPLKNGFEVLEEIKSAPELKMIPVIVLTSSSSDQDILRSYNLCASCYVSKPVDWDDFMNAFRSLENFWLQFVQLPPLIEPQNN